MHKKSNIKSFSENVEHGIGLINIKLQTKRSSKIYDEISIDSLLEKVGSGTVKIVASILQI